jgi:hypothetical protein
MKIEAQSIECNISAWAIPLHTWERTEGGPTHKVDLYMEGREPWQDEAILLETRTFTMRIGEHTDLQQRVINKLLGLKAKALDDAVSAAAGYEARIKELTALPHEG